MKTIEHTGDQVIVGLSKKELDVLANALNEVCNGIDIPEFDSRIGVSLEEVKNILAELSLIIRNAE